MALSPSIKIGNIAGVPTLVVVTQTVSEATITEAGFVIITQREGMKYADVTPKLIFVESVAGYEDFEDMINLDSLAQIFVYPSRLLFG